MSHFSSIGFVVETKEAMMELGNKVFKIGDTFKTSWGNYILYSDESGAELWLQVTEKNEVLGMNPHFKGRSKRTIRLAKGLEGIHSPLDGSFYSWSLANKDDDVEFPFLFDSPDYRLIRSLEFPCEVDIQLSAFAHGIEYFESELEYSTSQVMGKEQLKMAVRSFIPSGLFLPNGEEKNPPKALGVFAGKIQDFEERVNTVTKESFYWMLVDTLGGSIDVVVDKEQNNKTPVLGGVIFGEFWLSGRILTDTQSQKKGFLQRILGR